MLKFGFIVLSLCLCGAYGYFTLPGKCPDVPVLEAFNLADFYGKWYQAYYYSSDGQSLNNCSTLEFSIKTDPKSYNVEVTFNQSRVDRGLFHRFSTARVTSGSEADLELKYYYINAPRRLKTRKYQFRVLATNYKFYATVYTCQYSPLIDKHFRWKKIFNPGPTDVAARRHQSACDHGCCNTVETSSFYVWILSRRPLLNDVSKELALKPLQRIGVATSKIVKDEQSKCSPKYYEEANTEPTTFRYPVPI